MSESMKKIIEKTVKTTAASFAVVFLLFCIGGCRSETLTTDDLSSRSDATLQTERRQAVPVERRRRRRAEDYSRLPSNMPANWQIRSVGY